MMKNKFFLIIVSFLIGFSAFSQQDGKVWHLKDCINYALQHNPDLKSQSLNLKLSALNLKQSKEDLLPGLNASAGRMWNFGDKFDIYTNTFQQDRAVNDNYNLSTSVVLFSGFQKIHNIKKSKNQLSAAEAYLEKAKEDLILNVAVAYLNVLFAGERKEAAKAQWEISKFQMEKTRKLVQSGMLPEGNLLDVISQASSEELNYVKAVNNYDMAVLTLKQLMNNFEPEEFVVAGLSYDVEDFPMPVANEQELVAAALIARPEMTAARNEINVARENLKISKGGYFPSLSLNASLSTRYSDAYLLPDENTMKLEGMRPTAYITASGERVLQPVYSYETYVKPYGEQLNDNFYQYIGLNLQIPVFNRFYVKNNTQRSKIELEKSILKQTSVENNVRKTVQQAYLDAKAALINYRAAVNKLKALRTSFEYTRKKFDVGVLNSVDFQMAKSNFSVAELGLIQAKYDYLFKVMILNIYLGKEFDL